MVHDKCAFHSNKRAPMIRYRSQKQLPLADFEWPFQVALDGLGEILPPGFEITGLRQTEGGNEVVSILEWKSGKVADSQLSVLFKFNGDKIYEERWFIDTEQWKSAF